MVGVYSFHRDSAEKQRLECERMRRELPVGSVLLWFDWMENISLPIANVQTGEMFWQGERMPLSVFGIIIFENVLGKGVAQKSVIYTSQILNHDSAFAAEIIDHCHTYFEDPDNVREYNLWSDCGPHFRSYEFIGEMHNRLWESRDKTQAIRVNYFAEKHGKGLVDGIFAVYRGWLTKIAQEPGIVVKFPGELMIKLREQASAAMKLNKSVHYELKLFESDRKAAYKFVFNCPVVSIQKTYCLKISQDRRRAARHAVFQDFHFSDVEGKKPCEYITRFAIAKECLGDRAWKIPYYGSAKWDKPMPEKDKQHAILERMRANQEYWLEAEEKYLHTSQEKRMMNFRRALLRASNKRIADRISHQEFMNESDSDLSATEIAETHSTSENSDGGGNHS